MKSHLAHGFALGEARRALLEDEVQHLPVLRIDALFLELADEDDRIRVGAVGV